MLTPRQQHDRMRDYAVTASVITTEGEDFGGDLYVFYHPNRALVFMLWHQPTGKLEIQSRQYRDWNGLLQHRTHRGEKLSFEPQWSEWMDSEALINLQVHDMIDEIKHQRGKGDNNVCSLE